MGKFKVACLWVRFVITGKLPEEGERKKPTTPPPRGVLEQDFDITDSHRIAMQEALAQRQNEILSMQPRVATKTEQGVSRTVTAMDSTDSGQVSFKDAFADAQNNLSDAIIGFFLRGTFIGHQLAGMLAQHWLIDKACTMPARDAVRNWFEICTQDGKELDAPDVLVAMQRADKKYKLKKHSQEFVRMGRVFGVRIAIYCVESTDPEYYEKPFNIDSVTPDSYRGIVQVDPYWCAPELSQNAAAEPDSPHFYEPTWWQINGRRYHRSHLAIFRNADPIDILKPVYLYGGIPVPQLIVERVYAAERTANEAPQLAMTKRTTVLKTDLTKVGANPAHFFGRLNTWAAFRDNYCVKVLDSTDDDVQQFDISLADLDTVIMTGYQLVAASAHVPATKLLGTTPKGFNATGEYEAQSYHEELESIQENDLTDFVERHHQYTMRSDILPKMRKQDATFTELHTAIKWNPTDSPTALELSQIQLTKAQTGFQLVQSGAIDQYDERDRVRTDKDSDYTGIAEAARPDDDEDGGVQPGVVGAQNAVARADQTKAAKTPVHAGDAMDDAPVLITNQSYLDPDIVAAKAAIGDFLVQVSPCFMADNGQRYRIVIDGHHSLAAARLVGVAPQLEEAQFDVGDYAPA